jgi:hypothetical protein
MHSSPARWATAIAAAALIALPGSALAQSNPAQNPPSQPPTQTQPQTQPPAPQQPPAASSQTPSTAANGQIDANAARRHLTEARDSLSQLTSMPEAAKLQGDARTKVAELISNFNALITTQSDWHAAYGKVSDSLTALLGPDAPEAPGATGTTGTTTAGTTGTTGSTATAGEAPASGIQLDPAIRAKLVEVRTHLKEFEKAATPAPPASPGAAGAASSTGSETSTGSASSAAGSSAAGSMPPSAATASASNPSNPVSAASGAVATSGSEQAKPTAKGTSGTSPAAAPPANGSGEANVNAAAQSELAAIDAILAKSKTGALTKTQTAEIRRHIEALRALLK